MIPRFNDLFARCLAEARAELGQQDNRYIRGRAERRYEQIFLHGTFRGEPFV